MNNSIDLLIIGGGINGTAIAADAAGRGLSVVLCEKEDLASGTSSKSTKLIHGGLRYLEFYEFNLVRKALKEREVLMQRAPNVIRPLEFILPHEKHLRPVWMIRLGLFLYDHLYRRNLLPASRVVRLNPLPQAGEGEMGILRDEFKTGFSYYDCFTDDARLVVLNALSAQEHGAVILTRTEFISAKKNGDLWDVILKDKLTGKELFYKTKGVVNVAGPWINHVQERIEQANPHIPIRLDKGSHIIVPKLYEGDFAFILQHSDQRIIFTIPYHGNYTLIGTTDIPYSGDLDHIKIIDDEIRYLCNIIKHYFKKETSPESVISSYAGVRCLQNDSPSHVATLTRDYKFILNDHSAPFLLTIVGGKLTTHRMLAEEAVNLLKRFFPVLGKPWTGTTPLPGCNFTEGKFEKFYQQLCQDYPQLPQMLLSRYAHSYGMFSYEILGDAQTVDQLGEYFFSDLYECELKYLVKKEWAKSVDDILWRRTKLGLITTEKSSEKLLHWLSKNSI